MRTSRTMRPRGAAPPNLSPRQLLALVLLFAVTGLSFIILDRERLLDPFKGVAEGPVRAVAEVFADAGQRVTGLSDRFGNVEELRAENKRLQDENSALKADSARVKELERENEALIAQANFASKFPQYQYVPARVTGRDPTSRQKYFVINRGAEDGIVKGMPAVSPDFLVGLVTEVYPKSARVTLVIDENAPQLGVQLQQERSQGVLYGHWQAGGRLTMKYVDRDVVVPPNAPIITSGLTGGVPQGLIVGFAVKTTKDFQNDSQTIEVWPFVDFDSLDTVTIILTTQR